MKTFILCGGFGTRLDAEGQIKPKALIKIGPDPIIIHLIKTFIEYNIYEFVLCLGYKHDLIKKFFLRNYKIIKKTKKKNCTIIETKINSTFVRIFLVFTKLSTGTGGRIKLANKIIKNKETFIMTYCDGLANINLEKLKKLHLQSKKMVTVSAVQPHHRYGIMTIKNNIVTDFNNNNPKQNIRINGGYFIINPKALDIIKNLKIFWEEQPIQELIRKKQLSCFKHNGFWASLDTQKDKNYFNKLWKENKILWKKI